MRKLFYLFIILTLTGCDILYPSMMLKTPKDYQFTKLSDSTSSPDYVIAPYDFVNMRLFSNDGFKLIDFTNISDNSGSNTSNNMLYINNGVQYLVRGDGTIDFPVIGNVKVSGLSIKQAVAILEEKYTQFYIKPYVMVDVTNRRVIVFPGDPGTAKVIPLVNSTTTLIEAIALAGGITESGKAKEIKLIRGDPNKPQVYLIDLSTITGVKAANTVLQANDLIYITPQRRPVEAALIRLAPTFSLLTTLLLTITLINNTKF
ncbi:MAG TPA: polysaccharide biosynthesis/export family protein [Bacteroidia bacterium]|jgi:polysaccharide export outer membrane protein|nr:polysaccharide biosynthesis/export family protein [Bacteroidia bacterium]